MWLVRMEKFINRSGEVVELPGSLPWLVSHSGGETCRSPEQGTTGAGAPRGELFPPKLSNFEGFKTKVLKRSFMSLRRVGSWTPFRKTYGNFCFNKRYAVLLFHLTTGNVGRGKDGKIFYLFAGQFGQKEEKLGSVFFRNSSCQKPLSSSAMPEPWLWGSGDQQIPVLPRQFCSILVILQERCAKTGKRVGLQPRVGRPELKMKGRCCAAVVRRVTPGESSPSGAGMTI